MTRQGTNFPRTTISRRRRQSRAGIVMICVVVCMAIATSLLGGMLKSTLMSRQQLRSEQHLRQSNWLVEAGAQRAAFRLSRDPDYAGETWSLSAESITGSHPGSVTISVSREAEPALVRITAEYPAESVRSVRRSRDFFMNTTHN
jgi:hypothetical protein